MLFLTVPNISSDDFNYTEQHIRSLREISIEQQEAIQLLATIMKYNEKILCMKEQRNYHAIR